MNIPEFEEQSISFGFGGIDLLANDDINEAQVGYSSLEDGEDLCGTEDGDWKTEWLVIGNDSLQGDPIFIDSVVEGFPVYAVPHGEGEWNPELISQSYSGFINIILELKKLAVGREHPVGLGNKPMTRDEYYKFVAYCRQEGSITETLFWEILVSDEEAGIEPGI